MVSIYDATLAGPVTAIAGDGTGVFGFDKFVFKRPDLLPNGTAQTLPMFARGVRVDTRSANGGRIEIFKWSDLITVVG